MPEYIKKLLMDIEKSPEDYIGKKSLERLVMFLFGYLIFIFKQDGFVEHLPGFQEFVALRYNYGIHTAYGWYQIIRKACETEEEAFDEFYKLLYEFYDL